jgi:hypothetical protein
LPDSDNFEDGPQDSGQDPFPRPSPQLDRLIEGLRSLEQELRAHFTSELNSRIERIRSEYEERLNAQASQWEAQRALLVREIDEFERKVPSKAVQEEISATEAVMAASTSKTSLELERLIPDTASLGKLLQIRVEEIEMKAYLRGLKFRSAREE